MNTIECEGKLAYIGGLQCRKYDFVPARVNTSCSMTQKRPKARKQVYHRHLYISFSHTVINEFPAALRGAPSGMSGEKRFRGGGGYGERGPCLVLHGTEQGRTQTEESAIALAMTQSGTKTIVSDSKSTTRNSTSYGKFSRRQRHQSNRQR